MVVAGIKERFQEETKASNNFSVEFLTEVAKKIISELSCKVSCSKYILDGRSIYLTVKGFDLFVKECNVKELKGERLCNKLNNYEKRLYTSYIRRMAAKG